MYFFSHVHTCIHLQCISWCLLLLCFFFCFFVFFTSDACRLVGTNFNVFMSITWLWIKWWKCMDGCICRKHRMWFNVFCRHNSYTPTYCTFSVLYYAFLKAHEIYTQSIIIVNLNLYDSGNLMEVWKCPGFRNSLLTCLAGIPKLTIFINCL